MPFIEDLVNDDRILNNPERLERVLAPIEQEYMSWTRTRTNEELRRMDQQRGSWMNEDPPFHARTGKFTDFEPSPTADQQPIGKAALRVLTLAGVPVRELIFDRLLAEDPLRGLTWDYFVCRNILPFSIAPRS